MRTLHSGRDEAITNEPLTLDKETVRDLNADGTDQQVKGGWVRPPLTWSCPQATDYCTRG